MSRTSEFVQVDAAAREFKRDVSNIDFDAVQVVILITAEDGEMGMNVIGDLDVVAACLRSALAQFEESLANPN